MVGRLYGERRGAAQRRAQRAARALRPDRGGRPARQDLLGRHAPAARPRGGARRPAAGPVPRRADHGPGPAQPARAVGDDRGPRRRRHHGAAAPPSTWTRPTGSPTGIAVIDHGRVIAEGTADELKDRVGGERLEVHLADPAAAPAAAAALAPHVDGAAADRGRHGARERRRAASGAIMEAVPLPRPPRAWASTTWRCAARRSTTCSSSLTGHGAEARTTDRADDAPSRRRRHEPPRRRHARHGGAQPRAPAARARPADRLHDPADHVRAAVRLRVRRGDRRPRATTTSTS